MYDSIVQCFIILLDADVGSAFFTLNAGQRAGKEYLEHLVRRLLFPCIPVSICMVLAMLGHLSSLCTYGVGTATVWYFVNMVVVVYPFCVLRPGEGYRNFNWELIGLLAAAACGMSILEATLNILFTDYFAWTVGFTLYTTVGLIGLPAIFYDPAFEQPHTSIQSNKKKTMRGSHDTQMSWELSSSMTSNERTSKLQSKIKRRNSSSHEQQVSPVLTPIGATCVPLAINTTEYKRRADSTRERVSVAGATSGSQSVTERNSKSFTFDSNHPSESSVDHSPDVRNDSFNIDIETRSSNNSTAPQVEPQTTVVDDSTGKYDRRKGKHHGNWKSAAKEFLRRSSTIALSPRSFVSRQTANASTVLSEAIQKSVKAMLETGPNPLDIETGGEWETSNPGENFGSRASAEFNEAADQIQRQTRLLFQTAKAAVGAAKVGLSAVHLPTASSSGQMLQSAAVGKQETTQASAFVGYMTMGMVTVSVVGAWVECFSIAVSSDDSSLIDNQFSSWRYSWAMYLMLPLQAAVVFSDRKQSLRFNFAYLVYYAVVGARVPDYLGHASVQIFMKLGQQANENISRPGTPTLSMGLSLDVGRYIVSMGYMMSMAVYIQILRLVTRYMGGPNIFPRFLFHAQLYYYFFWYILITSAHKLDGLFWAMLVSMNIHYILVNTGVYDDLWVAAQRRYSTLYSWSSRAIHKVIKHGTKRIKRMLVRAGMISSPTRLSRHSTSDRRIPFGLDANVPSLDSGAESVAGPMADSPSRHSDDSYTVSHTIPFPHHVKQHDFSQNAAANVSGTRPRKFSGKQKRWEGKSKVRKRRQDSRTEQVYMSEQDGNTTSRATQDDDELMPLLFRIKLADQDSLADITSLFAVPALITVFASFAGSTQSPDSTLHNRLREPPPDNSPLLPPELRGEFGMSHFIDDPSASIGQPVYYGGAPLDLVNLWIRFGLMFMARLISSRVSRAVFSYKIRYFRLALLRKMKHTSLYSDEEHQMLWQHQMEELRVASVALNTNNWGFPHSSVTQPSNQVIDPLPAVEGMGVIKSSKGSLDKGSAGYESCSDDSDNDKNDNVDHLRANLWESSGKQFRDEDDAFVYELGFKQQSTDVLTTSTTNSDDPRQDWTNITTLQHTMVDEFQTCYWYFVFVTVSCAFSCFQHPDMPTRFTFCD